MCGPCRWLALEIGLDGRNASSLTASRIGDDDGDLGHVVDVLLVPPREYVVAWLTGWDT